MKIRARLLTILALAGSVAGQALAQEQESYGPAAPIAPAEGASPPVTFTREVPTPAPAPKAVAEAGPRLAISRGIINAAGVFDGYMRRASGIKPRFSDGAGVARAVSLGAVYEPEQIEQGAWRMSLCRAPGLALRPGRPRDRPGPGRASGPRSPPR